MRLTNSLRGAWARRNSVFFTPSAELLEEETAAAANVLAKAQGWPGLAAQSFALKKQILAVQPLAAADERIWEVRPEVSFAAAHGRPLKWPKSTWNGISLRRHRAPRRPRPRWGNRRVRRARRGDRGDRGVVGEAHRHRGAPLPPRMLSADRRDLAVSWAGGCASS